MSEIKKLMDSLNISSVIECKHILGDITTKINMQQDELS